MAKLDGTACPATRRIVPPGKGPQHQEAASRPPTRPPRRTPAKIYDDLQRVIGSHLTIATAGVGFEGTSTIDHVAIGPAIVAEMIGTVSNVDGERKLSDHFGVVVELTAKKARTT